MNGNDFDVPPVVDVPAEVRDRIEARVLPRLTDEQRGSRSRLWVASAAMVALLAGGIAVLATQSEPRPDSVPGPGPGPIAGPELVPEPDLDLARATSELDRCWETARLSGAAAGLPDRAEWRPVLSVKGRTATVTVVRTSGGHLFCETTKTRVTVSDPRAEPAYVPGTRTGAVLVTDAGTIAGVVDPSWPQVFIDVTAKNKDGYSGPAQLKDGLFVFMSVMSPANGSVDIRPRADAPAMSLPQPQPPISMTDPQYPPGDRTSERGKLLGECLAADNGAVDADSWSPGAMVAANGERLIMATNAAGTSACFHQRQRSQFMSYLDPITLPARPALFGITPSVGGQPVIAGVLPAGTTRLQLTFTGGATMDADVVGRTFAALLPSGAGEPKTITCKAFGSAGQVLYTGPLAD